LCLVWFLSLVGYLSLGGRHQIPHPFVNLSYLAWFFGIGATIFELCRWPAPPALACRQCGRKDALRLSPLSHRRPRLLIVFFFGLLPLIYHQSRSGFYICDACHATSKLCTPGARIARIWIGCLCISLLAQLCILVTI
jgi:hypothetical protein